MIDHYFSLKEFTKDFPYCTNKELAAKYQLPYNKVCNLAQKLKLTKSAETKSRAAGKQEFSQKELSYLRRNFGKLNNQQVADGLGRKLTSVRHQLYKMGLKRIELHRWSVEEIAYLKAHYRTMGDTEIADNLQEQWPKPGGWTLKHVEKKRGYLKLNRTRKQILAIHQRNKELGCWAEGNRKMWETRGVAEEGEIRYWRHSSGRMVPYIKVGGGFTHYGRYRYQELHGPLKRGQNVIFKDGNTQNLSDENLEVVTNAQLAVRNGKLSSVGLSDNYIAGILTHGNKSLRDEIKKRPELIQLKKAQLLLNRELNENLRD